MGNSRRVVGVNCDKEGSEDQWIKRVSDMYDKSLPGDAFRFCQSLNIIACLSVSTNSAYDSYTVTVEDYIHDGGGFLRHQQWRVHPKTNQLVNVQTGMCLTSFDSNTSADRLLAVGLKTCTKGEKVTMQQKWFLIPLLKC